MADTAHTGGNVWRTRRSLPLCKGFVHRGGGFIGVGEPSGHQYQGHDLQLAGVLGVEKETGFTLNYDKYNWDEHPGHFILEDCTMPVDFGEGKKSIYALEGTEVLVQRKRKCRWRRTSSARAVPVYISGLPYSFDKQPRFVPRILWSAHDEEACTNGSAPTTTWRYTPTSRTASTAW